MELLKYAEDEDYGDYTDVMEGRDIVVTGTEKEAFGSSYIEPTIILKPKTSPLSDDDKEIKEWLNNQPNPYEQFTKKSPEELKQLLKEYIERVKRVKVKKETEEKGNDLEEAEKELRKYAVKYDKKEEEVEKEFDDLDDLFDD